MSADDYDRALRSVLEVPAIASLGASRVVHCLAKPSFSPECSMMFVERDGATELVVRTAARSVWSFYSSRQGNKTGSPVTDWVKPPVSTERVTLTNESVWRAVAELPSSSLVDTSWGLDGMTIDVELWPADAAREFRVWFGGFDETDARHRFVRTAVDAACKAAQWELSSTNLHAVRRSLGEHA